MCLTGRMDCFAGPVVSVLKPEPCPPENPSRSAPGLHQRPENAKVTTFCSTGKNGLSSEAKGRILSWSTPGPIRIRTVTPGKPCRHSLCSAAPGLKPHTSFEADAAEAFAQDEMIFERIMKEAAAQKSRCSRENSESGTQDSAQPLAALNIWV